MKKNQNIEMTLYSIVLDDGSEIFEFLTPVQYAGLKRRKGFKKKVVASKKLAIISINIKTI
jgi:hypothetical protein